MTFKKILHLFLAPLLATQAFAGVPIAHVVITETADTNAVAELVKLYNNEAAKPNSKLSAYLAKLQKKNPTYLIDSTVGADQILRTDSGRLAPNYIVNYLINVQGAYKSSIFPVGFLKASVKFNNDDGDPQTAKDEITIEGPASVTIDGEKY